MAPDGAYVIRIPTIGEFIFTLWHKMVTVLSEYQLSPSNSYLLHDTRNWWPYYQNTNCHRNDHIYLMAKDGGNTNPLLRVNIYLVTHDGDCVIKIPTFSW